MHDIKAIRADPINFDMELARRGVIGPAKDLLKVDENLRMFQTDTQGLTAKRNEISSKIAVANKALADFKASEIDRRYRKIPHPYIMLDREGIEAAICRYRDEGEEIKQHIDESTRYERASLAEREKLLSSIPNIPAAAVPNGRDERSNVVVHTRGAIPTFDFAPREHDVLAARFGYDPDAAAAIAGARFAVLKGPLARLHRALGQFMIDRHVATGGYTEIAPPLIVLEKAVFGAGQLPKFEDDLFKTTDGRYLISTAEVSLTNLVREKILDAADLPLRFAALTPCFRSEAGSAGRDTRGLIRQHQFDKVELVSIVADAEAAAAEHERMTRHAEGILDALGLPYRRMLLCAGDMGFAARKTYDLEVWLPGQGAYREISSCSDCGDFQARRMDARFKTKGQKGTAFVHTLNGSALAVGRCLVAVIENYQRSDGSVAVPDVLLPYMGGVTELVPR